MSEYKNNKYAMTMRNREGESIVFDVYDLLEAIKTNSSELDHAIKKICKSGERGHKDQLTDLKEARQSIDSKIARIECMGSVSNMDNEIKERIDNGLRPSTLGFGWIYRENKTDD